jgi:hypothetical protein
MKIQLKQTDIVKRNPIARALADSQFRVRTVRDRTKYNRKQKHRKGEW